MAKILLQYTKNYDLFILKADNRDVTDERHIKALMESMQRNEFLKSKAITVKNEGAKYIVIDGQHRLEAAKRLGITLWYTVDDEISDEALPDLQIAKKWLPKDYLKHFVMKDIKKYKTLQEICETYPKVSITTVVLLLEGSGNTYGSRGRFETGTINIVNQENALKTLRYAYDMYQLYKHEWLFGRTFLKAFADIIQIEGYSQKIMMDRLSVNSENFRQMLSEEGYYKMFNEVYNYRATKNRIKFVYNK